MRILIIHSGSTVGGAEIYNLNLIKAFQKYYPNDELIFITPNIEFKKRIDATGARAIFLPVFKEELGTKRGILRFLPKALYFFYSYFRTILALSRNGHFDFVLIQSATEKIFLSPPLKILGFKVIWIEHGPFFSFPSSKEIFFLYKIASCFSVKVITVSLNTLDDALSGGINKDKLICVHTGISLNYFCKIEKGECKNTKRGLNIKKGDVVMGYLGDFSEGKGIFDFINIAIEVSSRLKHAIFLLVGKGELLETIKKVVKKFNLNKRFIFLGFKKEVRPFLGVFDVLLWPNKIGSISMVLLEAMSMGIPVVARDIGGNRELVINGKTGYLFKNESPEEVAEIIVGLLKNKKKREAMGKAARERVEKYFNEERWIKELHKVFEEVARK